MERRKFLKIAGTSSIILAAGGVTFVSTRVPKNALKPWQEAGSLYADPMRRALSYAILAPNPHNRQPWIVRFISETEILLKCDLDRLLPVTDPFSRQIVIGLGCFLELFSLAASEQGYMANIEYFPQGEVDDALDGRPIAKLTLIKQDGLMPDPLFAQVLKRRTNRNPYDTTRLIADDVLMGIKSAASKTVYVGVTNEDKPLQDLRQVTRDAMMVEFTTPEVHRESVELMRIGRSEIEANPDGISLGGAFLEALSLVGLLTRESLADPTSQPFQAGIDMFKQAAMTSMGFVWINTESNDRRAQVEAGRAYMRVALAATAEGLSIQPMSQALQEYATMAPHYKIIHQMLTNHTTARVQMLARLGYCEDINPAPRWPLATRIEQA
jgi:nitroreductase